MIKRLAFILVIFWSVTSSLTFATQISPTNSDSLNQVRTQILQLTTQLKAISLQIEALNTGLVIDSSQTDSNQIKTLKTQIEDTAWVVFQGDTLWPIFVSNGPDSPSFRAKQVEGKLNAISFFKIDKTFDSLSTTQDNLLLHIQSGNEVYYSVSLEDALVNNTTPLALANKYIAKLRNHSSTQALLENNQDILWRIGKVTLVIVVLIALVKLLNIGYRKAKLLIISSRGQRLRGFSIKNFEIINDTQVLKITLFLLRVARLIIVLILISFSLPIIFSLFPWTESLADTLLSYFLDPLHDYFWLFVHYIPNLISIIIISYIGHFILKFIKYLSGEIEVGNLEISGFYPEWAVPTYNLIRFGLYVIMLIFIFPFLPGSDSPIFKGVSVFVGILITMGSSSSVNNIIAGLILTYMRPFKKGDRIMIETIQGFVTEKTLLVTRLRTSKQEIITIPNSKILSTNIINYSTSIQENDGVIIHNSVTIGYDVPWRKVHKALLKAADQIDTIAKDPKPFVLQTSLEDFYVSYEINAFVTNVKTLIGTQSTLNEKIQDVFREEGIEIMSPHYSSWRNGEETTIPKKVKEDDSFKAEQVDDHTPELDEQTEQEEKLAKEQAKKKKTEVPKSFSDLIEKVTSEEEEDTDLKNEKSQKETIEKKGDKKGPENSKNSKSGNK